MHSSCKFTVATLFGLLVAPCFVWAEPAKMGAKTLTIPTPPAQTQTVTSTAGTEDVIKKFQRAKTRYFTNGDSDGATQELRSSVRDVGQELRASTRDARPLIAAALQSLDQLSKLVETKAVRSTAEFDNTFARVHHALGVNSIEKARILVSRQLAGRAGEQISLATMNLEAALARIERRPVSENLLLIQSYELASRLRRGERVNPAETQSTIESLQGEINRVGRMLGIKPVVPSAVTQ